MVLKIRIKEKQILYFKKYFFYLKSLGKKTVKKGEDQLIH